MHRWQTMKRRSLFMWGAGALLLVGIVLWPLGWSLLHTSSHAHADDPFNSPITISDSNYGDGTFSGNWESTNADVPAVTIATSQPVTIINSQVRGPGNLIATSGPGGFQVTIENTTGYSVNPNIDGRSKGDFFYSQNVSKVVIDHCDIENSKFAAYLENYTGNRSGDQTITITNNIAHNMDGRHSDGNGGYRTAQSDHDWSHFVQIGNMQAVPNIDISWNQVINDPYQSSVEDVINIFSASGTADSPLHIHDNYIQGAYPNNPKTDGYSGGGIITDAGGQESADHAAAYVHIDNNQVIATSNYGISFAAGHDNVADHNRVIASGTLDDGSYIASQNVGLSIWDGYGNKATGSFYNNHMHDNVVGWVNHKSGSGRNDMWFPEADSDYGLQTVLPDPITRDTEKAEWTTWVQKVTNASVTLGPQGAQNLGGLTRWGDYCRSLGYTDISLDGNTAFDWHCDKSDGTRVGIDVNDSCHWHYPGHQNIYATFTMSDPFSWECWTSSNGGTAHTSFSPIVERDRVQDRV